MWVVKINYFPHSFVGIQISIYFIIMMHTFLVALALIVAVVMAQDPDDHQIKLTYFNGKGLGEVSRMMLAIAGVEFEDKRAGKDSFGLMQKPLVYMVQI